MARMGIHLKLSNMEKKSVNVDSLLRQKLEAEDLFCPAKLAYKPPQKIKHKHNIETGTRGTTKKSRLGK